MLLEYTGFVADITQFLFLPDAMVLSQAFACLQTAAFNKALSCGVALTADVIDDDVVHASDVADALEPTACSSLFVNSPFVNHEDCMQVYESSLEVVDLLKRRQWITVELYQSSTQGLTLGIGLRTLEEAIKHKHRFVCDMVVLDMLPFLELVPKNLQCLIMTRVQLTDLSTARQTLRLLAQLLSNLPQLEFLVLRIAPSSLDLVRALENEVTAVMSAIAELPLTDLEILGIDIDLNSFDVFRRAKQLPKRWYVAGWSELEALGFDYSLLI
ncbi:MAG: uncharacterized protein KVP18_001274 [Porospora cf. gigantea A]|uniref:uncharacterized protein n=1 Tax=Porospora cf. gigantea A TaxID=2853593 RepID=UPI0035599AD2|nr:MAG: hypothetical protein KVP18_001274 [Porospora cf. gigantea A]